MLGLRNGTKVSLRRLEKNKVTSFRLHPQQQQEEVIRVGATTASRKRRFSIMCQLSITRRLSNTCQTIMRQPITRHNTLAIKKLAVFEEGAEERQVFEAEEVEEHQVEAVSSLNSTPEK